MTRTLLLSATLALGAGALPAADGLLAYDGFAYSAGRLQGNAGGTGWAGAWSDGHNGIGAESLKTKLGQTPATTGGRMLCANPDWASNRLLATKIGDKAGTWYISFLAANEAAVTPEHYIFLNIGSGDTGFAFGKAWMSDKWALTSPKEVGSNVSCAGKEAVFVVLKAIYVDAAGGDKVQAFFDPDLAKEPKIADIEMAGVDLPVGERVRLVGKQAAAFDELRIGTSWASVCPTK